MKRKRTYRPILLSLGFATALVAFATVAYQQRVSTDNRRDSVGKRIHEEDYPVADYQLAISANPNEGDKRKLRNKSHNLVSVGSEDLHRFVLKETDPEVLVPLAVSHPPKEVGIPVAASQVVTVGEVTSARAYLSDDKTSVYSEFVVSLTQILKNDASQPLFVGAEIAIERSGGKVRFPSGKVLLRGAAYGRNMPVVGRQYIFFLADNKNSDDFSLLTAYELHSGSVFALDHTPEGDSKSRQFAEYEEFEGMDENLFLNRIRSELEKR